MALESSPRGQIQELVRVLRRRRWQILMPALYVFVFGAAFAVIVPKKHVVQTRIEIQERRNPEDFQLRDPQQTAPVREIPNVDQHIRHFNRVHGIVKSCKLWPDFELLEPQQQQKLILTILDDITVDLQEKSKSQGSTFVDVLYRDIDETRAQAFLAELTQTWIEDVRQGDLTNLKSELAALREGEKVTAEKGRDAFDKYTELARRMELNPAEPPLQARTRTGEPAGDYYFGMLDDLRRQREKVQQELDRSRTLLDELEKRYADEPATLPKEVLEPGQKFDVEIAQLEEEILGIETELGRITEKNHSWGVFQREIEERRRKIEKLHEVEREETLRVEYEANPAKETLRLQRDEMGTEVAALESEDARLGSQIVDYQRRTALRTEDYARLMRLWEQSDELRQQHALASTKVHEKEEALRLMQESYGRKPFQNVSPPLVVGTEPNALLLMLFCLLAGLALGVLFAILVEYGRNAYRSVGDLATVMTIPVLGSIGVIVTRAEESRARSRRLVMGISSAVILGGVAWMTWVWVAARDRLPVEVEKAIESFQLLLM